MEDFNFTIFTFYPNQSYHFLIIIIIFNYPSINHPLLNSLNYFSIFHDQHFSSRVNI